MRTFEIMMIVTNVVTLILCFGKQSKTVRLWLSGANLSVFMIHGLIEGFRYQLIFSYIFVILLMGYTLVRRNNNLFRTKWSKVRKVIALCLMMILIGFTAFLACALPVFALPKPTGNYDVGVKYVHLVDENRNDPFLNRSSKPRELMIKIFYPAHQDQSKPYEPYFHDSPNLIRAFTAFYEGLPSFVFDHLKLVKTHSKENLQVSHQQPKYPVVLVSHGAGTTMEVQTSLCEDLASHGYMAVAIDHTYVSAATAFPDRIVSHKEATTDFQAAEPAAIISQIMADDAKFVMDQLSQMNEGKMDPIWKEKLDLDRIGVIGHSVGGAAAYDLAIYDDRIKAAINLDGFVYVTPKEDAASMAPILMLANDKFHIQLFQHPEKSDHSLNGLTQVVKASGNLYTIEGSDHMKFTDIGLFFGVKPLRELIGIGGETSSVTCLEITNAVSMAFFDRYLKGENKNLLESLVHMYPDLKKIALS